LFGGECYYESIKRELKTRPRNEFRSDERLKTKTEESTRLTYTGLHGELEHLKIKTRLIDILKKNGQFPDGPVRTKVSQIHHVTSQTY
jgi:hypothetical protein